MNKMMISVATLIFLMAGCKETTKPIVNEEGKGSEIPSEPSSFNDIEIQKGFYEISEEFPNILLVKPKKNKQYENIEVYVQENEWRTLDEQVKDSIRMEVSNKISDVVRVSDYKLNGDMSINFMIDY